MTLSSLRSRSLTGGAIALLMTAGVMGAQQTPCPPVAGVTRPSDVFFLGSTMAERGQLNSKNPAHLVACDVEVAGWLVDTAEAHMSGNPSQNGIEDFHYVIRVDPDFIAARYRPGVQLESVMLPGHLEQVGPTGQPYDPIVPATSRLPLADFDVDGAKRGITANSFLYATGGSTVDGELNAWWVHARGPAPKGWVQDQSNPDLFWPFDPMNPDGSGPLKPGDYVVLHGTLWQDGGHVAGWACSNFGAFCDDEELKCWNSGAISPDPPAWPQTRAMDVHGGWVEIHPVDQVRRVKRASTPAKTARLVAVCGATQPTRNIVRIRDWPLKPDSAQLPNTRLAYTQLIDGRFTDWRSVDSLRIDTLRGASGDTAINVHLRTTSTCILTCGNRPARFKATYILWWQPIPPPPPTMTLAVQVVSRTDSTKTIVVQAKDSKTGQPLAATVQVYQVMGRTGAPLMYSTRVPDSLKVHCTVLTSQGVEPSIDPRGKPVQSGRPTPPPRKMCFTVRGIVTRGGYEGAAFPIP